MAQAHTALLNTSQIAAAVIDDDTLTAEYFETDGDNGQSLIDVTQVHIPDVITLTARLAQVLAEEADLLEQMKVDGIAELQKEKLTLIAALEAQHRQLRKHPEVLDDISDEDRDDLAQVVEVFNMVRDENFKRLQNARAVNRRVVEAIAEVVTEANTNGHYDEKGKADKPQYSSLSVTLNEKI